MKRFGTLLFCMLAIFVAACSDQTDQVDRPAYGGYGGAASACAQYTTCGTCTPVNGCGWCAAGSGGYCSDDPYSCDQGAATWNWNPQGCRAAADASVKPSDAGGDAPLVQPISEAGDAPATQPIDAGGSG
jgi:hypothetical protein